jgi:hypothetical protein
VQGFKIHGWEKNRKKDSLKRYKKPRDVGLEPEQKCEKRVLLSRIKLF